MIEQSLRRALATFLTPFAGVRVFAHSRQIIRLYLPATIEEQLGRWERGAATLGVNAKDVWRRDQWPRRNALNPAESATAMRWRNAALVRRAASLLLRMFPHSIKTFGTVDRFSPPRSVRASRPAAPM